MSQTQEGGFYPPAPLSPPDSVTSQQAVLPAPRGSQLKAGSLKESMVVDHVDRALLDISGKFERRFTAQNEANVEGQRSRRGLGEGYRTFDQLAMDLNQVLDVVWISATPSLQIPYLINISFSSVEYIGGFPFSPRAAFQLLHKIDVAVASLLTGINVETTQPLLSGGRRLTMTERVRMAGIVDNARLAVAKASRNRNSDLDGRTEPPASEIDTDMEDVDNTGEASDSEDEEMALAKVFELTLSELGASIGAGPTGPVFDTAGII